MDRLVIQGGHPLRGRIRVSGAKNAALPCLAAALLTPDAVVLSNLPAVADIRTMVKVLQALGTGATWSRRRGFELTRSSSAPA